MRPSNKSRNRNRNNRRVTSGNIVNRVFDSSGPEGRVRGTPQQVIEKYSALAHDAHLSGDRVAAENFMQHSEHYSRLLSEAQKENDSKQESDLATTNNGVQNNIDKNIFVCLRNCVKLCLQVSLNNVKYILLSPLTLSI